jgi:hypothetical protein
MKQPISVVCDSIPGREPFFYLFSLFKSNYNLIELSIFCLTNYHKDWNGPLEIMIQPNFVVCGSIPGRELFLLIFIA